MPQPDFSFWLGLALAIPLSIVGNLLTPFAENQLAKRSKTRTNERLKAIRNELLELEPLAGNPQLLLVEMLRSVLWITFLCSFFGTAAVVMGMLAEISDYKHLATNSSKLFVIVGAITVLKEAFAALIKVRNVKVFDLHRNVLEGRIDQLELNIKR